MSPRWRDVWDQLIGALAGLVLLVWIAYFWERSTGLTWATRRAPGTISTAAHLVRTRNTAIGVTAFCGPLALVYFTVLRRKK